MGGLGLRSAARTAAAAYWAAWIDASQVLAEKAPAVHHIFLDQIRSARPSADCVRSLQECERRLERAGCTDTPSWEEAAQGAEAP